MFMGPRSPPTAGLRGWDGEVSPLLYGSLVRSPLPVKPSPGTHGVTLSQGPRPPTARKGRGRVCTALSWVLAAAECVLGAGARALPTARQPIQLRAFLPERLCTGHPRGVQGVRGPGQVSSLGTRMPPEALEPAPEGRPRWTQLVVVSGEQAPGRAEEG